MYVYFCDLDKLFGNELSLSTDRGTPATSVTYQFPEYIEWNGGTSSSRPSIDLGVQFTDSIRVEMDIEVTEKKGSYFMTFNNSDTSKVQSRLTCASSLGWALFTQGRRTALNELTTGRNTLSTTLWSISVTNGTDTYTESSDPEAIAEQGKIIITGGDNYKLYGIKVYDGDTLVLDLSPVISASGSGALFDELTNRIYPNSGEPLTYGGEIEEREIPLT